MINFVPWKDKIVVRPSKVAGVIVGPTGKSIHPTQGMVVAVGNACKNLARSTGPEGVGPGAAGGGWTVLGAGAGAARVGTGATGAKLERCCGMATGGISAAAASETGLISTSDSPAAEIAP